MELQLSESEKLIGKTQIEVNEVINNHDSDFEEKRKQLYKKHNEC